MGYEDYLAQEFSQRLHPNFTNKLVYYGLGELRENKQDSCWGNVSRRWRWSRCGRSKMVGLQSLDHLVLAIFCSFHPYQARAFKLLKNFDFFRSFLMNECSVDNVELKPVELETSKQFTLQT